MIEWCNPLSAVTQNTIQELPKHVHLMTARASTLKIKQHMIERGNPLSTVTQITSQELPKHVHLTSQVTRFRDKNSENEKIRTLLDRQREQILADCQAELRKHEFQAHYDRRGIQKLSETIESQQEELHRAQAEERRRQDHQLLHEQLLKQNWDPREAHGKSLNEIEEVKKFQSSTFDTIARRRLVEDQDSILELTGRIQELQMKLIA